MSSQEDEQLDATVGGQHAGLGDNSGFVPKPKGNTERETSGHKPGKLVGNEVHTESHVEVLPAGTAPPESTFAPNTQAATDGSAPIAASDTPVGGK